MHFVFDFDHTIYNTAELWDRWLDELEAIDIDRIDAIEKGESIFGVGFTLREHAERLGLTGDESEELISSFKEYAAVESPELIFKDAVPFVELNSKKHEFSILSFGDPDWQKEKMSACGISDHISDIRIARPERHKTAHLRELVQETDEQVVFVDDNPKELVSIHESEMPITLYRMI